MLDILSCMSDLACVSFIVCSVCVAWYMIQLTLTTSGFRHDYCPLIDVGVGLRRDFYCSEGGCAACFMLWAGIQYVTTGSYYNISSHPKQSGPLSSGSFKAYLGQKITGIRDAMQTTFIPSLVRDKIADDDPV
jgi:hypothetical protein